MQILELQQWVRTDWEQHSNTRPDPHLQLLYLFEELGEMAEAIRKSSGYKDRKDEVMDLEGEMGDVLIALATVANNYNIDLDAAVQKSKIKIEERHRGGF
ncbi:MAG TPA: MazG nucleotide pyrophosphohydrolase domain-containing protein [Candidatus Paceibacterota bacterium]|nr:MazG nucleotide pyrophosphohydrolase domain-containing protein [Candidatus Paceibacterota bacterium]